VKIQLDRGSELPLGVQLAWHLRAAVAGGELKEGERLPSVREMAAASGVNANTVRAVYARLEAEGVVATEHGRGTFVTGAGAEAGDGELAKIAQRAARAARDAGLDPRAVAAALFVSGDEPAPRTDGEGARRRVLRKEIAALERRLADARLQRRLAAHADDPIADPPRGAAPGRLLSATELESVRDDLAERLALLEDAERVAAEPAPAPSTQHSTAPSAKVTLAPSAPRWRLGHSS
jgi:DNA-binding transcriptional regulator YhcF (GntR family)